MWQLRKLSTNEPLSEAGPLPNNWGPIFGLHGFLDKIGNLLWIGPAYADQGWVELTEPEQKEILSAKIMSQLNTKKVEAGKTIVLPNITVEQKSVWVNYLLSLDLVPLQADFPFTPRIPTPPVV
jgi:hypothetical protein